jgi:hypothetical protein
MDRPDAGWLLEESDVERTLGVGLTIADGLAAPEESICEVVADTVSGEFPPNDEDVLTEFATDKALEKERSLLEEVEDPVRTDTIVPAPVVSSGDVWVTELVGTELVCKGDTVLDVGLMVLDVTKTSVDDTKGRVLEVVIAPSPLELVLDGESVAALVTAGALLLARRELDKELPEPMVAEGDGEKGEESVDKLPAKEDTELATDFVALVEESAELSTEMDDWIRLDKEDDTIDVPDTSVDPTSVDGDSSEPGPDVCVNEEVMLET